MYAANASPVIPRAFPRSPHGGECSGNESFCFFAGLGLPGAALSVAESLSLSTSLDISANHHPFTSIVRATREGLSLSTLDIFAKTT